MSEVRVIDFATPLNSGSRVGATVVPGSAVPKALAVEVLVRRPLGFSVPLGRALRRVWPGFRQA